MKTVFRKIYDGESLYDLQRDMVEAFDEESCKDIPTNKHYIMEGRFTVSIIWESEDEIDD